MTQRIKKGVLFSGTEVLKEVNLRAELTAEREDFSGIEVYFIKKTDTSTDYSQLLKEDRLQSYDASWLIRIKKQTKGGWETPGGDAIRNFTGIEFSFGEKIYISKKNFHDYCGVDVFPESGDLIYIPMAKALFEINFSNDYDVQFYAEGSLYTYTFELHSYIYSGETFNTGIDEVDTGITTSNPAKVNNNQLIENEAKKRNVKNELSDKPDVDFGDL